ncbi:MAG: hypothetical protein SWX82_12985 [Cyanobacteriota bacterium]|nr:hypothetical protein [Cyanobacteriota bacterium]
MTTSFDNSSHLERLYIELFLEQAILIEEYCHTTFVRIKKNIGNLFIFSLTKIVKKNIIYV